MKALIYIQIRSLMNQINKLLRKPVGWFYMVLVLFYGISIIFMFRSNDMKEFPIFSSKYNLVYILSAFILVFTMPSLMMYAKKKGVIFKVSDVHFIFPSPISPKLVLVFAHLKGIIGDLFLQIIVTIFAITLFDVSLWTGILYLVVSMTLDIFHEYGLLMLFYANEQLPKKLILALRVFMYGLIASVAVYLLYLYFFVNSSPYIFIEFFDHPILQCIPYIGWNIAFIRLVFLGPTTLNVICTILYVVSVILLFIYGLKMKSTGAYYEDAMKFADDYKELMRRSKKGEAVMSMGSVSKKKKFKQATVTYKGNYASSIFYRQLLEYRKERFFIFDMVTLVCILGSIVLCYFSYTKGLDTNPYRLFFIPAFGAYLIFIFSAMASKWTKELENPYTYLIPDTPLKKLWYATLIEHVKSLINGCILAIPGIFFLKLSPIQVILTILIFMGLIASKLYIEVFTTSVFGTYIGNIGRQFIRMFGQILVIGIGVLFGVLISIGTKNINLGFIGAAIGIFVVTGLIFWAGSMAFTKMDVAED